MSDTEPHKETPRTVAAVTKHMVAFDRSFCNDFAAASSREWLVTNAIGGYASGTIAGCATRRYHGILLAALHPPVGRTQLVAALDEIIDCGGKSYELAAHSRGPSSNRGCTEPAKLGCREKGMNVFTGQSSLRMV